MLNATLCATGRAICCLLETYQEPDGVRIPEVLVPFMGGITFLPFVRDARGAPAAPGKAPADKTAAAPAPAPAAAKGGANPPPAPTAGLWSATHKMHPYHQQKKAHVKYTNNWQEYKYKILAHYTTTLYFMYYIPLFKWKNVNFCICICNSSACVCLVQFCPLALNKRRGSCCKHSHTPSTFNSTNIIHNS